MNVIKRFFHFISDMATLHHEMEVGRLSCPKCKENKMRVEERGVIPVGVCGNCNFKL